MTSEWTFTVTHYDESASYTPTVLTSNDVDSIPMFTDNGAGEVNSAILILNCGQTGKFLTQAPILDQFDKIRIAATDGQGGTYDRVFEVKTITPSEDNGQGTTAQIECLGNEWYLQHLHYARPQWFQTAFDVMKDIGDTYNLDPSTTANGGKLPDLSYHDTVYNTSTQLGNALPKHTLNVYDYGTAPAMMYDVMMDLVDRQAGTVDLGGVLDYFDLGFDTDPTNLHTIYMRCPSSGSDPEAGGGALVEIDATNGGTSVNTNTDEQEGGIQAQRATRVLSWGELGAIPNDPADYLALELDWIFVPEWNENSITYYPDSLVVYKGYHYIYSGASATVSAAGSPPVSNSNWSVETWANWLGTKQYSPWTVGKAALWAQAGANIDAAAGSKMMWDGNLVINYQDGSDLTGNHDFYRTWAHEVGGTDALGALFSVSTDFQGTGTAIRSEGHRVLNLGGNQATGTDSVTGKPFDNAILEWKPNDGGWIVLDKWNTADMGNKVQCAVLAAGKTFEFASATGLWTGYTNTVQKTDCFHTYDTLTNVDGFQTGTPIFANGGTTKDYSSPTNANYRSAIQMKTSWNKIVDLTNDAGYFKGFAGLCFQFPYPVKSDGDYGEAIGALYGNSDTLYPSFFDPQNMNYTSNGGRGFNNVDSTDYGQVLDLSFMVKITETLGVTNDRQSRQRLQANFPCRVTCYDSKDNVVVLDVNVPFRDNWTDMHFQLDSFKVYRGSKPVSLIESLAGGTVIRPKEQELANIFEWRNLKLISIQLQSFYDDFGRYSPLKGFVGLDGILDPTTQVPLFASTVYFEADAFRFTKRNMAMATASTPNGVETTRNIEAPFMQRNQIFSKRQLEKDALGEAQRLAFRHKDFVVGTQGKFDIRFSDSFLYTNPRIVYLDSSQYSLKTGEAVNTIKLVAKKIEYSMTKVKNGRGGFLRKIYGSRRFE